MSDRLEIAGLSKTFPGVQALDGVSLRVAPGEIRALLGENGAGKSTLAKILCGVYQRDHGQILVDGEDLGEVDERAAGQRGIVIVHQEGSLVPQLSVAENIFAGRQPTGWLGQVNRSEMRARSQALINELGVVIDPRARVVSLSPAQCQVVEIAKALSQDLRILVLDEPTAALTTTETERLFQIVRKLAAEGVTVIYVSHRLAEIFALCDSVTVLKDGRLIGTRKVAETDTADLIRMMVGRDVHFSRQDGNAAGEELLAARNVAAPPFVRDASLTLRAGEIVCLAGLIGAGRTEFCECLMGARRLVAGSMTVGGEAYRPGGVWDGKAAGLGMVPEDRKSAGLFLGMDIAENISATALAKVSRGALYSRGLADALARGFVRELRIATPGVHQRVGNLSGGNQQKVLIAKWLALEPRILIVDEPTRGVDVGARSEIYRLLRELRDRGVGLIVVSSDLPEVLALADRIVVMAEGRTVGELPGTGATEEQVLALATQYTSSVAGGRAA